MNSLRIRLIAAVQELDQDRDQDSESLTRRPTSVAKAGKKKKEIPSVNVQKRMIKIKCPECEAFITKEMVQIFNFCKYLLIIIFEICPKHPLNPSIGQHGQTQEEYTREQ